MVRQIIKIDEEKCNGCGLCATACHEGAIELVDGKAKLIRDDYCDGLGDCLPACPTGAITFENREAAEYDEKAVQAKNMKIPDLPCGCPGTQSRVIEKKNNNEETAAPRLQEAQEQKSELNQWPVQIKLVPINAPYFENANLLIAADCTAYAYANFHSRFIKNRITLIGCPKLDDTDYSEKLTEILKNNNIKSVAIVKMEVPCCNGILAYAQKALQNCGKMIPWQVHTVSIDGELID